MKPETLAIHAGYQTDPSTGALTPPIHLSTTFERDEDGGYSSGHVYTRDSNPNRHELEARLAALEGGSKALCFASGSAAFMCILQALHMGVHVIAPNDMYYGIQRLLREVFPDWGLNTTFVAAWDVEQIRQAIRPNTRLIIIETPSNPMMNITDIRAVADIAHAAGALLVCDNTIATPIFQQPLALGADVVIHATTKYLGGHSDLLGGAVIVKDADHPLVARLQVIQKVGGAVPSPFDCWLTMRGLFTLPQRMKAVQANALAVATFLAGHARIEQVLHVGHPSHPQYALGMSQMSGYSGLFSFLVKGTAADAIGITNRLRLIKRATSFGGVHSTIEHRASVEVGTTTPHNLLRLSVGLEHPDDLIADLSRALGD
jgi:cystathionine gamma-synthase